METTRCRDCGKYIDSNGCRGDRVPALRLQDLDHCEKFEARQPYNKEAVSNITSMVYTMPTPPRSRRDPVKRICKNCFYCSGDKPITSTSIWVDSDNIKHEEERTLIKGTCCHRYPSRQYVDPDDWCGEYTERWEE